MEGKGIYRPMILWSVRTVDVCTVYRTTMFHLKPAVLEVVCLKASWLFAFGMPINSHCLLFCFSTVYNSNQEQQIMTDKTWILKIYWYDPWDIICVYFIVLFFGFSFDRFKEVLTIIKILLTGVLIWKSQILFCSDCICTILVSDQAEVLLISWWEWDITRCSNQNQWDILNP